MLFSELYNITKQEDDTWFDPIMTVDTKLFIDPFLLYQQGDSLFRNGHSKIIRFFQVAFELAAKSNGNKLSLSYKKLLNMLSFPEAHELCLGYSGMDTKGLGSGFGFSEKIASVMLDSIRLGIVDINHFEEMAILEKGIGKDRISDITANILKSDIIAYTQSICDKHKIPSKELRVRHSRFNYESLRWENEIVTVPVNPFSETPLLLVPESVLRDLPSINSDDFIDWAWDNENETLRTDFNFDIKSNIRKEDIIKLARERYDLVEGFINFRENRTSAPYDLEKDIYGFYRWYEQTQKYRDKHPMVLEPINSEGDLPAFVESLLNIFEVFIVDNSGYKLLWNEKPKKPKIEEASQLLFLGIVKHYCFANNIDISREVDIGRGPVDFKFSTGFEQRVLLEVKRASNSKFYDGLEKQLVQYLKGEQINYGFYLVIVQKDEEFDRAHKIQLLAEEVSKKHNKNIKAHIIDARDDKPSASKL